MLRTLSKVFIVSSMFCSDTVFACHTAMDDREKLEEGSTEKASPVKLLSITDLEQKIMKSRLQSEHMREQQDILFRRLNEQEIAETTQKLLAISTQRLNSIIAIMKRHPAIQANLLLSGHAKEISDEGLESIISYVHRDLEFQDLWSMIYRLKLREKYPLFGIINKL